MPISFNHQTLGWGILPAVMIFIVFFVIPTLLLFFVSLWVVDNYRLTPAFSMAAYERTFAVYGTLLVTTLLLAGAVACLCVVTGIVFAFGARYRCGRFGDAFILATMITLFGGYLVKIYAWKSILSSDGILNSILIYIGFIGHPLPYFIYNRGAVVIALTNFLLPFAILPIFAAMRNVPEITLDAARDLGASPFTAFAKVILPQCRVGVFVAFSVCFLSAAGDYVTPMFLGGGNGSMLGQFIVDEFSTRFNWPGGAAMSFSMMGAAALVIAAVWFLVAREVRRS